MVELGKNIQSPDVPTPQATANVQDDQNVSQKEQKGPLFSKTMLIILGFFALLVASEVGYLAYINFNKSERLQALVNEREQEIDTLKNYINTDLQTQRVDAFKENHTDRDLVNLFVNCPSCPIPEQSVKSLNIQKGESFFDFAKNFSNKTEFIEKANMDFTLSGYVGVSEPEVVNKEGVQAVWKLVLVPETRVSKEQVAVLRFTQKELDEAKVILINTEEKEEITIQEIPPETYVQVNFTLNLLESSENYDVLLLVW